MEKTPEMKLKAEIKDLIKQYNELVRNYTRLKMSTMEIIRENIKLTKRVKELEEDINDGR